MLLNAFFVAAEFGMVKLRNTRVQSLGKQYGFRGKILEQVHKNLDAYLSACQLGITLASLGLGWIGEPAFADLLEPLFNYFNITSPEISRVIAFFTAFFFISFLHIVIGELMPKSLAIRQAEKVSVWTAVPLYAFYWFMFPLICLLNACSNYLLNVSNLGKTSDRNSFYSSDEIKMILHASRAHGELTKEETEIIQHTLEFADLQITEVMRSRDEMIAIDIHEPVETQLKHALEQRYSRYPIYDSKTKEMIGIVHMKDLFAELYKNREISSIKPFMRPILKVSHRLPALDLLRKFREGMPHFALVYKGSDNLLGFVTLDNLLHILIGRIKDEFHKTQEDWVKNEDGSFTVKGKCSIYALERALNKDITVSQDEQDIDTVGGLIVSRAGVLPKEGYQISFDEFDAMIEKIEGSYIRAIKIIPKK